MDNNDINVTIKINTTLLIITLCVVVLLAIFVFCACYNLPISKKIRNLVKSELINKDQVSEPFSLKNLVSSPTTVFKEIKQDIKDLTEGNKEKEECVKGDKCDCKQPVEVQEPRRIQPQVSQQPEEQNITNFFTKPKPQLI